MISEAKLKKIKDLIDRKYRVIAVTLFGERDLPPGLLRDLKAKGLKFKDISSLITQAYRHNLQRHPTFSPSPMQPLKADAPPSPQRDRMAKFSIQQLNGAIAQLLAKQKDDLESKLEGLIRQTNQNFKFEALAEPDRPMSALRAKTNSQLKSTLAGYAQDANRNWDRVVHTEVSNAIGLGSAERLLADGEDEGTSSTQIICYRIVILDGHTCKHCRSFYLDSDGTPALYRLSDLIANGSNYGKRTAEWRPCLTATHPNERCSPILRLRPGWKVLPGGNQTFVGKESWESYIRAKIR